jgi:hypothetical protein
VIDLAFYILKSNLLSLSFRFGLLAGSDDVFSTSDIQFRKDDYWEEIRNPSPVAGAVIPSSDESRLPEDKSRSDDSSQRTPADLLRTLVLRGSTIKHGDAGIRIFATIVTTWGRTGFTMFIGKKKKKEPFRTFDNNNRKKGLAV